VTIHLVVNGHEHELASRSDESILTVLRRELGLLSVRETCGIGVCGACTVLLDGEPVSACLLLAPMVDGRQLTTVEGLPADHPVVQAFGRRRAFQCGYCTPGMVLTAAWLLEAGSRPTEAEVRETMSGNLCRCGSYPTIVAAVLEAAGG
jgi:aerobic-type carbon monoxide dehydrogenase small subunit (CoxS/CutS family)